MRFLSTSSAIGLLLIGCAASSVSPVSVPLQYKMMASPAEFPALQSCASVSSIEVNDSRTEKTLGVRVLQENKASTAPVTAASDVAAWVRSGLENCLKQGGVAVGKAGGPVLRVTVDSIKTDESVFHRAQYDGRIMLTAQLIAAGGSSCWKEQVDGFSENYGYAGSAENYQETLNHALDRAVIRILSSAEFKRAACACGGA